MTTRPENIVAWRSRRKDALTWVHSTTEPARHPNLIVEPLCVASKAGARPSGETVMKEDVELLIRDWQEECADHPSLHNQGNVLLSRLKALKPSLAMNDFLNSMDAMAPEGQP